MTSSGTRAKLPEVVNEQILDEAQDSLLDLVDNLLNRGVVIRGDVVLGVAGVDLIYLQLSALLCAADRILPGAPAKPRARRARKRR